MGKTKLHITVEFDDTQGFNSAMRKISKFYLFGNEDQLLEMKSNYKLRINKEVREKSEPIDCRFERQEIEGKERIIMIIPSQLNKE